MTSTRIITVGEIARSVSDTHKKQSQRLIFLNTSDIFRGKFNHLDYTDVSKWPGQAKKSVCREDILFSEIRPGNGRWAFVNFNSDDVVVSTKLMVIRANIEIIRSKYLYFFLTSDEICERLQNLAESRSGTFPQITFEDIAFLEIRLPCLDEQDRIINLIEQIDSKLQINRQLNETLEGMAQAIFRDWFVDFGPVRRAQAGTTDPVAIMGGLIPDAARAAQYAANFPAAFGNDRLPVGWGEGTLARLAMINSESWKSSNHPDEVEYVDLSNTKWGTIESTTRLAWKDAPSRARRIARVGDSIIGTVRPGNGSFAFIGRDGYTVSTGFAVLRPKQAIYTDAIYVAATASDNITRLANLADGHGGAYPAVNPDVVAATPFPDTSDALLTAFSIVASPLRQKIEQTKLENQALNETRDYLLPRLMSGAVRVSPKVEAA